MAPVRSGPGRHVPGDRRRRTVAEAEGGGQGSDCRRARGFSWGGGGEKMFSNQTVLTTAQLCEHTKPTE